MRRNTPYVRMRERSYVMLPVLLAVAAVAAAFWAAFMYVRPEPPKTIVIATASVNSPYWREVERYRPFLERNGVNLEQRITEGSFENIALLADPRSGVHGAIIQGGIGNASSLPGVVAIGRVGYEPVWIFTRGKRIERLTELRGKRILIGPAGGGTNFLAKRLLAAAGITDDSARLIAMDLRRYPELLAAGEADAGVLVLGPEAETIRRLFATPGLELMSMLQADAIAQRFPYLEGLMLKHGVVDLAANIPTRDTQMVATMAALVVRDDMHSALANLLTQAVVAAHDRPVVGPNGEAPVLESIGGFPRTSDPEFPLSDQARRVYKSGAPFLQRYLPFWWATLIDRTLVLLLPIFGVLIPALRLGPMVYTWRVRRRLLHWYKELKALERGVHANPDPDVIAQKRAEIDAIEAAVNELPIPLMFSDQLYNLRNHIDVVRRRLAALSLPVR